MSLELPITDDQKYIIRNSISLLHLKRQHSTTMQLISRLGAMRMHKLQPRIRSMRAYRGIRQSLAPRVSLRPLYDINLLGIEMKLKGKISSSKWFLNFDEHNVGMLYHCLGLLIHPIFRIVRKSYMRRGSTGTCQKVNRRRCHGSSRIHPVHPIHDSASQMSA